MGSITKICIYTMIVVMESITTLLQKANIFVMVTNIKNMHTYD